MAIEFEWYQNPQQEENSSPCYHVRAVNSGCMDTDLLASEIEKENSLTQSDVKATLVALSQKLAEHLGKGERVYLEGIGYFQVTLAGKGDPLQPHQKVQSGEVRFKSVSFRADQRLKEQLAAVPLVHSHKGAHSALWDEADIDGLLIRHFKDSSLLTRHQFQEMCGMTTATACRSIRQLVAEKKLRNISHPHNPVYVPGEMLAVSKTNTQKRSQRSHQKTILSDKEDK